MDYGNHYDTNSGFSHLSENTLRYLLNHGPDNDVLQELKAFLELVVARAEEIWDDELSQERKILRIMISYLSTIKDFANEDYPERHANL